MEIKMVKVKGMGPARMMEQLEALRWFRENGFTYTGRWADGQSEHLIFTKGTNIYQMIIK